MLEDILNKHPIKVKEGFISAISGSILEKIQDIKKTLPNKMVNKKSNTDYDNDSEPDLDSDDMNESIITENLKSHKSHAILSKDELELHDLSNHDDYHVRSHVASNNHTSPATLNSMVDNETHDFILGNIAMHPMVNSNTLKKIILNPNSNSAKIAAKKRLEIGDYIDNLSNSDRDEIIKAKTDAILSKDPKTLHDLSKHPLSDIRKYVASNKNTLTDTLLGMESVEKHPYVKSNLSYSLKKRT